MNLILYVLLDAVHMLEVLEVPQKASNLVSKLKQNEQGHIFQELFSSAILLEAK